MGERLAACVNRWPGISSTYRWQDTVTTEPLPLPPPDPLIGRDVGGFIVEQPLGEGGMGLVYRARHPILNRHFAVKVLLI